MRGGSLRGWRQAFVLPILLLILFQSALATGLCSRIAPQLGSRAQFAGEFTVICTPRGQVRIRLIGMPGPADEQRVPASDQQPDCPACLSGLCHLGIILVDTSPVPEPTVYRSRVEPVEQVASISVCRGLVLIRGPPSNSLI